MTVFQIRRQVIPNKVTDIPYKVTDILYKEIYLQRHTHDMHQRRLRAQLHLYLGQDSPARTYLMGMTLRVGQEKVN